MPAESPARWWTWTTSGRKSATTSANARSASGKSVRSRKLVPGLSRGRNAWTATAPSFAGAPSRTRAKIATSCSAACAAASSATWSSVPPTDSGGRACTTWRILRLDPPPHLAVEPLEPALALPADRLRAEVLGEVLREGVERRLQRPPELVEDVAIVAPHHRRQVQQR